MRFAAEWPGPGDVLTYYDRSVEALECLQSVASTGLPPSSSFIGLTPVEFEAALRDLRDELDRQVSMALLASCEALLRVDFWERVGRVKKEPRPVRARFKELADQYAERVPLEDILEVWRDHVGRPERFAAFQEYLRVRHWLAHGRYWPLRTARKPEPPDVLLVIRNLFSVLPGFPTL